MSLGHSIYLLSIRHYLSFVIHIDGCIVAIGHYQIPLWGGQLRALFSTHYLACFIKGQCIIRFSSFINLACSYFGPGGYWWRIWGPHTLFLSTLNYRPVARLTCSFILVFEAMSTFVSLALCYNSCVETRYSLSGLEGAFLDCRVSASSNLVDVF